MECGWVWAEVGKQALQALEELKVDSEMGMFCSDFWLWGFFFYQFMGMECF